MLRLALRPVVAFLMLVAFAMTAKADESERGLRAKMRECSWTVFVRDGNGDLYCRGSCTVSCDDDGNSWAIGCFHVIEPVVADNSYSVTISKPISEDDEPVGRVELKAKIVKHSQKDDLALMLVGKKWLAPKLTIFKDKLPLDTTVWHCGTFYGEYDQRISKGTIQGYGYRIAKDYEPCDGADFIVHPGSSGVAVFNKNCELVGVVSFMHGPDLSFFVPARRIVAWLENDGAGFVIGERELLPEPKVK